MNKGLKGLLVAFVAITGCVQASQSNNKTHFNTRVSRDSALAQTTFHVLKSEPRGDRFGSNIQLTGIYGRSTNGSHLGKNFGADGTTTANVVADTYPTTELRKLSIQRPNVIGNLLLHNCNAASTLAGTLRFSPRQIVYGGRIDYYQCLGKFLDGLYAEISAPLLHVENNIHMKLEKDVTQADGSSKISLNNLFYGAAVTRGDAKNKQDALKYGKLCTNSKTGLGDLEARVGWKFIENEECHAGVNLCAIFPTGNKPNPEYLWSARTGESKWGLGLGVDGSSVLWEEEDENLKIFAGLQYKYLFEGDERRTFGLKTLDYKDGNGTESAVENPILSHYYLVGTSGVANLKPLANVSTLRVDVRPGSQLEGNVMFAYNNGNFSLDFGYNLFWKEAERVKFKTQCSTSASSADEYWTDSKYGVAGQSYEASADFNTDGDDTLVASANGFIKSTDLYREGAETPAQMVHKALIAVGYTARNWEYPVMVGAGVAYDIPSNNKDAAEGYTLWAKCGVAF